MKKLLTTLTLLTASAGLALAGSGKAVYDAKAPLPDPGCDCFGTGFEFGAFGGGLIPNSGDGNLGGGASIGYFFTEDVGVETSYSVYSTDPSAEHLVTVNLVYRLVDRQACIAPYLLLGGGLVTNGETNGLWDLGGGVDLRLPDSCIGLFADATYNWVSGADNFTLVRIGVRIPF